MTVGTRARGSVGPFLTVLPDDNRCLQGRGGACAEVAFKVTLRESGAVPSPLQVRLPVLSAHARIRPGADDGTRPRAVSGSQSPERGTESCAPDPHGVPTAGRVLSAEGSTTLTLTLGVPLPAAPGPGVTFRALRSGRCCLPALPCPPQDEAWPVSQAQTSETGWTPLPAGTPPAPTSGSAASAQLGLRIRSSDGRRAG